LSHLAAEVTLDLEVAVDVLADLEDLFLREVADLGPAVDLRAAHDLEGAGGADPVDVAKRDVEPLVTREIDAGDTCHDPERLLLTLPLLVTWVGADHEDPAAPTDHATAIADPLDRRPDLHALLPIDTGTPHDPW